MRLKRKNGEEYGRASLTIPKSILERVQAARARGHKINLSKIASDALVRYVDDIEQLEETRARALAKLTDEERAALGI